MLIVEKRKIEKAYNEFCWFKLQQSYWIYMINYTIFNTLSSCNIQVQLDKNNIINARSGDMLLDPTK